MDFEQQINELNRRYERAKDVRNRALWRMEELEKEEKELNERILADGLDPNTLESDIETIQAEIETLLKEAEALLPEDR
ncbi:Uncharacterised protein [Aedoeadaptatus ivorii]|uniref:Uncharacterized protein n=1 Tax=Aedoeadaptatus ivorii TaxID=54006 RepID=A0A3S4Z3S4_9FIRM|nr:hypothetical protein [Peptoniphilus ivorii]MDQ0507828.1 chromosome segregation ATPase [Peptoniphilus ivorii]VEJ35655.1 Uncharacterised protein [Peptoniphilus ivorii]